MANISPFASAQLRSSQQQANQLGKPVQITSGFQGAAGQILWPSGWQGPRTQQAFNSIGQPKPPSIGGGGGGSSNVAPPPSLESFLQGLQNPFGRELQQRLGNELYANQMAGAQQGVNALQDRFAAAGFGGNSPAAIMGESTIQGNARANALTGQNQLYQNFAQQNAAYGLDAYGQALQGYGAQTDRQGVANQYSLGQQGLSLDRYKADLNAALERSRIQSALQQATIDANTQRQAAFNSIPFEDRYQQVPIQTRGAASNPGNPFGYLMSPKMGWVRRM